MIWNLLATESELEGRVNWASGGRGSFSSNFVTSMNILMLLYLPYKYESTLFKETYNLANHTLWMGTHFLSIPDSHSASLLRTLTPLQAIPSVWETFFPFLLPQFGTPVSSLQESPIVCAGGREGRDTAFLTFLTLPLFFHLFSCKSPPSINMGGRVEGKDTFPLLVLSMPPFFHLFHLMQEFPFHLSGREGTYIVSFSPLS